MRIIARDESNVSAASINRDGSGASSVDMEPVFFGHWDQAKKVRTAQGRGLTASRSAYEEMTRAAQSSGNCSHVAVLTLGMTESTPFLSMHAAASW